MGLTGVKRVESLNDSPHFIRALADIAAGHLGATEGGQRATTDKNSSAMVGPTSKQLLLRCPGCKNPKCGESKAFFARSGLPKAAAATA